MWWLGPLPPTPPTRAGENGSSPLVGEVGWGVQANPAKMAGLLQPRQGRQMVVHGASRGKRDAAGREPRQGRKQRSPNRLPFPDTDAYNGGNCNKVAAC